MKTKKILTALTIIMTLVLSNILSVVGVSAFPTNSKKYVFGIVGGTGFNGSAFIELKEELQKLYPNAEIVDLDLPGHTNFEILSDDQYTYDNYVKNLENQLNSKKLKNKKVILVGHSLGGSVVLGARSSNIEGKVIVDGSAYFSVLEDPNMQLAVITEVEAIVKAIYGDIAIPVAHKDFEIDLQLDIRDTVAKINSKGKPILIIAGQEDPIAPVNDQIFLKNTLGKKATLRLIEGEGHALPLTNPKITAQEIQNWISKN